jgi:hypothetical protein
VIGKIWVPAAALLFATSACSEGTARAAVRINLLGYLPDGPKAAVLCVREGAVPAVFTVQTVTGTVVYGPVEVIAHGSFGPCAETARLEFDELRSPGEYRVVAGAFTSPPFPVGREVLAAVADSLLYYLRQQRSLYNPLLRDSAHQDTDGILVDHARAGEFIAVAGGWADAADYLQYVTTSATVTFHLLAAWRDARAGFEDRFDDAGLPGANEVPDVLDEARWGLTWLLRMYPTDDLLLHQIGDDRDHAFLDLPTTDSSDYGWGRGGPRPVYPCTGRPQGLLQNVNRSDGIASAAGKFAAAFALGAMTFGDGDPLFSAALRQRALSAYRLGLANPGVCQTAPGTSTYFYEEANWVDDMELAAAQLREMTGDDTYESAALEFGARESVAPWMGADTARHYEWYPWHNHGHHEIWRSTHNADVRDTTAAWYEHGIEAVIARADNGFLVGIPFIWCSNDLMVAFATQALQWRRMSGDARFRSYESAAFDWLFGANPWGRSFVIGLPRVGSPTDPHSVMAKQLGVATQTGGLVDGPVNRTIFGNLAHVTLSEPDELSAWNTGAVVYHDDWGDYSTNEPILDGTAALVYLVALTNYGSQSGGRGGSTEAPSGR